MLVALKTGKAPEILLLTEKKAYQISKRGVETARRSGPRRFFTPTPAARLFPMGMLSHSARGPDATRFHVSRAHFSRCDRLNYPARGPASLSCKWFLRNHGTASAHADLAAHVHGKMVPGMPRDACNPFSAYLDSPASPSPPRLFQFSPRRARDCSPRFFPASNMEAAPRFPVLAIFTTPRDLSLASCSSARPRNACWFAFRSQLLLGIVNVKSLEMQIES